MAASQDIELSMCHDVVKKFIAKVILCRAESGRIVLGLQLKLSMCYMNAPFCA